MRPPPFFRRLLWVSAAVACLLLAAGFWREIPAQQPPQPQQKPISSLDRSRAADMLAEIHLELKKSYYDGTFRGIDVDARYKEYLERLKHAPTLGEAFRVIAAYLSALNDSHTFFIPPRRSYRFDYGYRMRIVGEQCFITETRPGSDAEKKLHPGDQVLTLGKFSINRADLWQLEYYLNNLAPTPATDLTLRDPAGGTRTEQILTKFAPKARLKDLTVDGGLSGMWDVILEEERQQHLLRHRYVENGDLMIWSMPTFIMDAASIDGLLDRARKHKTLILDLRGNPGGAIEVLKLMVGGTFDHDVTIGKRQARKDQKSLVAKSRGHDAFSGQLIVLVDSRSASASELFARIVQLERRGTVVGDRSSGSVMESMVHQFQLGGSLNGTLFGTDNAIGTFESNPSQGPDRLVYYAASITDADLIMSDGKSLEKAGVTPDVVLLPTAPDLAAGRDPVLAKAAELAGVKLDPAAAGKMFPFEWTPF